MKQNINHLWNYRELLIAFTLREIKIRYKQTLLGASWAILQPAALTIIFSIVFGIFLKVTSGDVPYPIFAYSALLPWTFFATSISFGALSVVNNGNLVTKVYFPREILPFAAVGAAFIDFLSASSIFLLMFLIYKVSVSPVILYVVIIIPAILLLTTGISLIFSTLNVMFRDIRFVVPLVLQIWLYLSPVIYSIDQVPEKFRIFYVLNPMAPLIQSFRDVTVFGKTPNIVELSSAIVTSLLIFVVGYLFFKSKEKMFADVI